MSTAVLELPMTPNVLVEDGLLTVPEASEFLRIGVSKLYQLMDAGRLTYVKLDRSRRIPRRALVEFAASNVVTRKNSP